MSVCYTFTGNRALTKSGRKRNAATIPLRQRLVILATGFYVAFGACLAASVAGWLDRSRLAAPRSLAILGVSSLLELSLLSSGPTADEAVAVIRSKIPLAFA